MRYAWFAIAVFAARFLVTAIAFPELDGDLAWQRWLGATIGRSGAIPRALGPETFSAAGAPWLPQEWLFSLIAAHASHGFGWIAFSGAVAMCAVAALALSAWRAARRGASARAVALCTGFAGIAMLESFGVRAQVVAWPLVVLYLIALDSDGLWFWAALPVAAIWSNLHASAMLAPFLAALAAAGTFAEERRWTTRTRRFALLSAASLVAICCNPFGWHLPQYALSLFVSPIKGFISEWKVTDVDDLSFAFGALPLMLAVMLLGARSRTEPASDWRDAFVFCAFGFLALSAARNVPLFGLIALPLVAARLTGAFEAFAPDRALQSVDRFGKFGMPAIALGIAVLVAAGLLSEQGTQRGQLAETAVAALERAPGDHRVFCADFSWCGFMVGAPHVRVFLDGRADPYPRDVWNDFVTIVRLHEGWAERLDARHVDAVIVARGAALDQALALRREWRAGYADLRYRLWMRVEPAPATARAPAGGVTRTVDKTVS